jgi:hypothetical protein
MINIYEESTLNFWIWRAPVVRKAPGASVSYQNIELFICPPQNSHLSEIHMYKEIWIRTNILPSYGTAGSMIPRYLFCTGAPPAGFSIYIFISTTVTFIGTSGHSVQMYWIFVSTRIFIFSLEIADIFILPWYHAL